MIENSQDRAMAYDRSYVDESWPKWKVALAVGAPVALGVAGVWLYKRRRSSSAVVKSKTPENMVTEDRSQVPQACYFVICGTCSG